MSLRAGAGTEAMGAASRGSRDGIPARVSWLGLIFVVVDAGDVGLGEARHTKSVTQPVTNRASASAVLTLQTQSASGSSCPSANDSTSKKCT